MTEGGSLNAGLIGLVGSQQISVLFATVCNGTSLIRRRDYLIFALYTH
jgi:hypothetical protein